MVYAKTIELNSSQPWVSDKTHDHLQKINNTIEWMHDKLKEQVKRKPHEPVIFYVVEG